MKKALLILISFYSFNLFAYTTDWHKCQQDSDCVEVDYYCIGGIVNKKFIKEAQKYYSDKNKVLDCMRKDPSEEEKKIKYRVFCRSQVCRKEGFSNKKPGFN